MYFWEPCSCSSHSRIYSALEDLITKFNNSSRKWGFIALQVASVPPIKSTWDKNAEKKDYFCCLQLTIAQQSIPESSKLSDWKAASPLPFPSVPIISHFAWEEVAEWTTANNICLSLLHLIPWPLSSKTRPERHRPQLPNTSPGSSAEAGIWFFHLLCLQWSTHACPPLSHMGSLAKTGVSDMQLFHSERAAGSTVHGTQQKVSLIHILEVVETKSLSFGWGLPLMRLVA